ncbi:MAG: SDR family NAD(P)-dependent oxidoreductase [Dehalococcoidia bacterium]|jgi:NAD(P)-dependent dehydrogenase (short-subunit alcohol dehydrogenase family)|nr:SDR family NAD(P)-dependent oxidoreductase [Dehalococcoidia bacterium]|tara:strand:- start:7390 stop:8325 length:936 start_codon:yes stop_codon:yes gene_type:complete
MGNRLEGKVAIVTGGGGGIGRGVCRLLAEEGASVVVNDVGGAVDGTGTSTGPADELVSEIKENGGVAVSNYDTIATMEGAGKLVQAAIDNFGRVDILMHVAGILRDRMVFNMTEEEWDAVLSVHLYGAFNTVKQVVPHLIEQRSGRIIIFSSGSGLGNSGQTNYAAAKEGQVGFVRSLSRELAPFNITVNAVYPGGDTRMTGSIPDSALEIRAQRGISSRRTVPTKELWEPRHPDRNAPKAVYLCTDAAENITGEVIGTSGPPMTLYTPRHVSRVIHSDTAWTLDQLEVMMPNAITDGIPNPAPAVQPEEK